MRREARGERLEARVDKSGKKSEGLRLKTEANVSLRSIHLQPFKRTGDPGNYPPKDSFGMSIGALLKFNMAFMFPIVFGRTLQIKYSAVLYWPS